MITWTLYWRISKKWKLFLQPTKYIIKKSNLCYDCLSENRPSGEYFLINVCRHCNRKHHSLIHDHKFNRAQETNIMSNKTPLCESLENASIKIQALSRYALAFLSKEGPNCSYSHYALVENCSTISLHSAVDKIKSPRYQTTIYVATDFGDPSINANLLRLDVGRSSSIKSLFRLNYVYSFKNWHFKEVRVAELNQACAMYPHSQHVDFPQLTSNKNQVLLSIDAMQYIIEREFCKGPKVQLFQKNLLGWTITGPIKKQRQKDTGETIFISHSYKAFDREMMLATLNEGRPLADFAIKFWSVETKWSEHDDPKNVFC